MGAVRPRKLHQVVRRLDAGRRLADGQPDGRRVPLAVGRGRTIDIFYLLKKRATQIFSQMPGAARSRARAAPSKLTGVVQGTAGECPNGGSLAPVAASTSDI